MSKLYFKENAEVDVFGSELTHWFDGFNLSSQKIASTRLKSEPRPDIGQVDPKP